MDLSFIFFIFAAFIVIPGTFFGLALFNKYLAAGIATIGMLVLFILFGIQFFGSTGNYIQQTVPMKWPPSINMCPDYLSLYKDSSSIPTKYYCVDTVGVSPNQALTYYNPNTAAGPANPSVPMQFNLHLEETDDIKRRDDIVNDCKTKSLTFEGIWDGTKTYNNVIPRPLTV